MKLRIDLLKHLTVEDVAQAAEANVHRFEAEPLFFKTGTGSLSLASTSERAQELEHSTELTRKLESRAKQSGTRPILFTESFTRNVSSPTSRS